jgi:hypothetical protein
MNRRTSRTQPAALGALASLTLTLAAPAAPAAAQEFQPGREVAVTRHLADGDEYTLPAHRRAARRPRLAP